MSEDFAVQMKGLGVLFWFWMYSSMAATNSGTLRNASAPDASLSNITEEAFHHIEPGGAGGGKVHMKSPVTLQPSLHTKDACAPSSYRR